MSDRYISVKYLEEMMQRHRPLPGADSTKERYAFMEWLGIYNAIKDAPTIEAEPVRKGKWTYAGYDGHVKCDMCAKTYDWFTDAKYFDFCPNCGADMRGEAERSRR